MVVTDENGIVYDNYNWQKQFLGRSEVLWLHWQQEVSPGDPYIHSTYRIQNVDVTDLPAV